MPRAMKWFTTLRDQQALPDAGQVNFNLSASIGQSNIKGSTITRLIIDLWTAADTLGATKITDWGIAILNTDAVVAGAFPDADNENEKIDWLVRGRLVTEPPRTGSEFGQHGRQTLDIRSARIIRAEDTQVHLVADDPGAGGGGVFLSLMVRMLLKLP